MPKVWLVAGSGRGLGRDIVKAALAAGDRVVRVRARISYRRWYPFEDRFVQALQ